MPVRVPGPTTSGVHPKVLRHISSTIGCIGGTTFETIAPPTRAGGAGWLIDQARPEQ